jgi:hypothetical protein
MSEDGSRPESAIPDWLCDALVAVAIAMVGSVALQFIDDEYGPNLPGMQTASIVVQCGPFVWFMGRRSRRTIQDLLQYVFPVAVLLCIIEYCDRMQISDGYSFGMQMAWILGWSLCEAAVRKLRNKSSPV